ncbi:DUF4865 family protein [Streptomyces mangrovisoli]|uniref:DUF4865 domain-containing protein n=1 Tax=Streptomyces mangrovisoli TaxID=1428628 RepID=A0A1J4P1M7_9ACTN|nr:DUF4865 family protein [Streptomyces mangrovisoli]OIJ68515.1 DUF4865 domain-containing protein [Streptomyces mangrovisoli]
MHAMQYELTLPADHDMGIIRARVARVGHLLDTWDGLGTKAYLLRERGRHGSRVNQYAPFYLWDTVEGMNAFLFGGAFQGLANDFGRPDVRQWTGLAYEEGSAPRSATAFAVRHRQPVPQRELAEWAADAVAETRRLAGLDGAVLAAAAVDTRAWELVHFSLWETFAEGDAPKAEGDVFEVLHLSAPGAAGLRRGRQW